MTHLILGLHTEQGSTGYWANLEYPDHALEGVAYGGCQGDGYKALISLDNDLKILRPKQLSVYTNDFKFAQMFTKPIRLEFEHFPLLRILFRINKWKFYHNEKMVKPREQWTLYRNVSKNI
jgi:hypothetical protein